MKLLVGTSNGLFLVENKKITKVLKGSVYGITHDENYIYAFNRKGPHRLVILDKKINVVGGHDIPCSHVHQALYDPEDKKIYVTSTGSNCLVIISPQDDFQFKTVNWHKNQKDHSHINSLFKYNGHIYVYEHDLKGTNQKIGNGGVRRLNKDFKSDIVWRIGDQGHNIYIEKDNLYICDTFNRRFIRRKLNNKYKDEYETLFNTEEYGQFGIRGLSIGENTLVVGLSKWLSRNKRATKHTGYLVWYDRNYNKIDDLYVEQGQIFEIRLLDQVDYAHNRLVF